VHQQQQEAQHQQQALEEARIVPLLQHRTQQVGLRKDYFMCMWEMCLQSAKYICVRKA